MNITPNEIAQVEEIGSLDSSPVKMIKTKGGFWIAVGKPRGKLKEEAIAAGSHPAIVKYNMEKQHPEFQPSLMKSEMYNDGANVDKHSHFLSDDLRKSGHDIYSVQEGHKIEFHVTKHNVRVQEVGATLVGGEMKINEIKMGKEFARAMAGAVTEKATAVKASSIKIVS